MSGIDMDAHLVETATKVVTTYNEMGDKQFGSTSTSACLYRDITTLNHSQNRYEVGVDGLLWFGASENVVKGDLYYHPSEGYLQIVKVIRAKTLLTDDIVQFIKCQVAKQRQVS